ncbi:uncharacterized protein LOC128953840 [Oppia nitens]|uniref:uncharacterized protein LOC128953840 n=1 Tax=Oppia nitens TaxID=1686743 RepID=UPI0023DBEC64|nr:uncharacterized protein LOC128953840 [Oppia nitens]
MPGYDCDRFVNLSPSDRSELSCSICQDIFCCPVIVQCCRQTFCEDCINNWLSANNTCPYDRKTLTKDALAQPPRVMINILGKLQIKCDFQDKGCNEVISLEDLSNHVNNNCRYNSSKSLITETISVLTANLSVESLLREIHELKAEKKNFLKTIQELTDSQEDLTTSMSNLQLINNQSVATNTGISSQSVSQPELSELEIIIECRKHLWSPQVIHNMMNREITEKVLSIVRSEINGNNSLFMICQNIFNELNDEFGYLWHCRADYRNGSENCFSYELGYYLRVKFSSLVFDIYKTQYLNVDQLRKRLRNGKLKREIQIVKTNMTHSMISMVNEIIFAAIDKSVETIAGLASEMKYRMDRQYPAGKWHCFMYEKSFGGYNIHPKHDSLITFEVADLKVTLFQAIND